MMNVMIQIMQILFLVFCGISIFRLISFAMDLTSKTEKIIEIIWVVSYFVLAIVMLIGLTLEYFIT